MGRTVANLFAAAGVSTALLMGAAGLAQAEESQKPLNVLGVPSENPGAAILGALGHNPYQE